MIPETPADSSSPLPHWPRPLAFTLSGGGAYGAVQVGMLKALGEAGVTPDLIVGCSVGALNGVRYALDPTTAVDDLTAIWKSPELAKVFGGANRMTRLWNVVRNGLRRNAIAILSPERLANLIDEHLGVEAIEQLSIPTAVVATDALVGLPKVFRQGRLTPVLLASAAVPGVFPPVKIDGGYYIDGGVSANMPLRQTFDLGARSVVALDATPATMPGTLPTSLVQVVSHASAILLRNQRADDDEFLKARQPVLHIPRATPPTYDPADFSTAAELIEAGYRSTRAFLDRLPELTDPSRRLAVEPTPPAPDASGTERPGSDKPSPPPPVGWRTVGS